MTRRFKSREISSPKTTNMEESLASMTRIPSLTCTSPRIGWWCFKFESTPMRLCFPAHFANIKA